MGSTHTILDLVNLCDNFHVSSSPDALVPWRLDSSAGSPVIGLLRPEIVKKLLEETSNAWHAIWTNEGQKLVAMSFASETSTPVQRTDVMKELCERWRDEGFLSDVIGKSKWRNEMYPVYANPFGAQYVKDEEKGTENYVFEMERSACALFGVVTYGVHMTVYEEDEEGSIKIWVPTRAKTKPTWPGYLDNTVAGGIPSGLSAWTAIVKESMEEASIDPAIVQTHAKAVGAISYFFATKAGWLQPEIEFVYDLRIPSSIAYPDREKFRPKPLDGEVEAFELLPLDEVLKRMRLGLFKANCAVVIIDFLIRKGFITPDNEPNYMEILTRMHSRFEYEKWGYL
ncbi:hypothetical protein NEOLEDRAFT_274168 [Neolentinus lepideus HHB14362 ss-1]|uniref:Nudix hydrolase domain-containing protein n=1 Tax=Neolentinus lepideus HHB14362 ss-1 TaxID=1314782 RepID=A0A165T5G0_9AGAM|nr:hypothetical protein NEOLEDRAFT_274168 [Neolentinus lepideus HHB14362 ss-1]